MMGWVKETGGGLLNVDTVREPALMSKEEHLLYDTKYSSLQHGDLYISNQDQAAKPQGANFLKTMAIPLALGIFIVIIVYRQ